MHSESTRPSLLLSIRDPSDLNAWRQFEARYRELIVRYCLRRGLQAADCEDVQQLVWLHLSKGMRNFEYDPRKGRFRDYLGRVVRNAMARHFARPNRNVSALDTKVLAALRGEDAGPGDEAWEAEWVDHHFCLAMRTVEATFDARSVEVFQQLLRGQPIGATAVIHGMSEQAIHKVKQRIQQRMRELIARQVEEEDNPGEPRPVADDQ